MSFVTKTSPSEAPATPIAIVDQINQSINDSIQQYNNTNMATTTNGTTSSSSSIPDSDWSKDRLMGKSVSFKGISQEGHSANRPSTASSSSAANGKDKIDPMLWGRPGHLTDAEAETFVSSSTFYTASAVLGLEHYGLHSRYDRVCVCVLAVHCVGVL
jgi:hypothetical protein